YIERRSEWPIMTRLAPASFNISPQISPVCAPCFVSVERSWAATLMFDPSRRSATALIAVYGGATATSQWFAFATSGLSEVTVATASPINLCIFQFPAMTGLRITFSRIVATAQPGKREYGHEPLDN